MGNWLKTAPDGRKVYFPWGILSKRGYVVESENDLKKILFQDNVFLVIALFSAIEVSRWKGLLAGSLVWAAGVAYFIVRAFHWQRKLKPYDAPPMVFDEEHYEARIEEVARALKQDGFESFAKKLRHIRSGDLHGAELGLKWRSCLIEILLSPLVIDRTRAKATDLLAAIEKDLVWV